MILLRGRCVAYARVMSGITIRSPIGSSPSRSMVFTNVGWGLVLVGSLAYRQLYSPSHIGALPLVSTLRRAGDLTHKRKIPRLVGGLMTNCVGLSKAVRLWEDFNVYTMYNIKQSLFCLAAGHV